MRKTIALVASMITVAVMSGCSAQGNSATTAEAGANRPTVSSSSTPSDAPSVAPEPSEAPSEAPDPGDATYPFGSTVATDNGIKITVSGATTFTPSEYAAGAEKGKTAVKFDITVLNGSGSNYDPNLFFTTLQSANTEAQIIVDSDAKIGLGPSTTLLPGREAKWTVGYAVTDPADLVMEVSPGFEFKSAIFTNAKQ